MGFIVKLAAVLVVIAAVIIIIIALLGGFGIGFGGGGSGGKTAVPANASVSETLSETVSETETPHAPEGVTVIEIREDEIFVNGEFFTYTDTDSLKKYILGLDSSERIIISDNHAILSVYNGVKDLLDGMGMEYTENTVYSQSQ